MESQKERASFNEVQRFVQDCNYPCSKEDLIDCARQHQAPTGVIHTLEVIQPEAEYSDLNAVREGVEKSRQ